MSPLKVILDAIKELVFKTVLTRLNSSVYRQKMNAPVLFETMEIYAKPYIESIPKFFNFVILKLALSIILITSFFILLSDSLRQLDTTGAINLSAFFVGYSILFFASLLSFFLVKSPKIIQIAERTETTADANPLNSPAVSIENLPKEYSNVEILPTSKSAKDIFLSELRAERDLFFSQTR